MTLADRVAVVTGSAQAAGRGYARALAAAGAHVVVADSFTDAGQETVGLIETDGGSARFFPLDVTDEDSARNTVAFAVDTFGRLDVLVNNAGVGIGEAMHEITTKYLDMQLGVNLRAVIIGTREALPLLREAGAEHGKALIVNTASIAGKSGQPWLSVYSATKAAVIGFSEATQKEVSGQGIQVTALCPGFVDTPMTEYVREMVKPEEMIRPEDISEAVRFLLRTSPGCLVPEMVFARPDELSGAVG